MDVNSDVRARTEKELFAASILVSLSVSIVSNSVDKDENFGIVPEKVRRVIICDSTFGVFSFESSESDSDSGLLFLF